MNTRVEGYLYDDFCSKNEGINQTVNFFVDFIILLGV